MDDQYIEIQMAIMIHKLGRFLFDSTAAPLGQNRILLLLKNHQPISQKRLQDKLGIRSSSLAEMLEKLEHIGYIKRQKNPDDKRQMIITLTDNGISKADELYNNNRKIHEKLFEHYNTQQKQKCLKELESLYKQWIHLREDETFIQLMEHDKKGDIHD